MFPTAALIVALAAPSAQAQTAFQLTLTNTGGATWDEGVLAVLPGASSPNALLAIGQSPTSGDPYDSYAYVHTSCDLGQEDDADAALLIARWPALVEGVNAFRVGPLAPAQAQVVSFDASPGDVVSFVAHVVGAGDDAAVMHEVADPTDAAVDLFDGLGQPLTTVAFAISGFDVNDTSPTGNGGGCAATCPPSTPCYVSSGGGAAGGTAQPVPGGCVGTWYFVDADGDGLGSGGPAGIACVAPPGSAWLSGDCDDGDPAVGDTVLWYPDLDLDGFGDPAGAVSNCTQPPGLIGDATDCDDTDADNWLSCGSCMDGDGDGDFVGCDAYATRPGPDCDDADPALNSGTTWYLDADSDGFGAPGTAVVQCAQPPSSVLSDTDCDDANAAVSPAATEVCGGGDEDCDGLVDDADPSRDPASAPTWYTDADGDGSGDPATGVPACIAPPGSVASGTDCSDADPDNWNSCGTCVDADGDSNFIGCDAYATRLGPDCDDSDPALNAGTVWFDDGDGDGHGDPATGVVQCAPPGSGVLLGDDCDDANPSVNPAATEICGGSDEDCDGLIDDGDPSVDPSSMPTWYADLDGDLFGDAAAPILVCALPPDASAAAGDCDDAAADVYPGAVETCDGRDEDCDGTPDDNAVDAGTWYPDSDADGHGNPANPIPACTAPPGAFPFGDDCDDAEPLTYPGALEFCDGADNDCDGVADDGAFDALEWFLDADGDGFGDDLSTTFACAQPAGYASVGLDCDDADDSIHPQAPEQCDGVDQDCDGTVDNDVVYDTWWADRDGDGWGDEATELYDCVQPPDSADRFGDCDDTDPRANPDGIEIPGNGIDEDCDGTDTPIEDTGIPIPEGNSRTYEAPLDSSPEPDSGCACNQGGAAGLWPLLALLGALGRVRRRSDDDA